MAVTPSGGEGTLDTWRCPCQCGGRLDKTGVTPMLAWMRGRGQNHGRRGVCEPVLEPRRRWEGSRKKAKVSNRTREIRPSGIIGHGPNSQTNLAVVGGNEVCRKIGLAGF